MLGEDFDGGLLAWMPYVYRRPVYIFGWEIGSFLYLVSQRIVCADDGGWSLYLY